VSVLGGVASRVGPKRSALSFVGVLAARSAVVVTISLVVFPPAALAVGVCRTDRDLVRPERASSSVRLAASEVPEPGRTDLARAFWAVATMPATTPNDCAQQDGQRADEDLEVARVAAAVWRPVRRRRRRR
jgi:hypothetical protein